MLFFHGINSLLIFVIIISMNDAFLRELENDLADGNLTQFDYDRFKDTMAEYDNRLKELQKQLENGSINRGDYSVKYGEISAKIRNLGEEKRFLTEGNMKKRQKRSENRYMTRIIVGIVTVVVIFVAYKVVNGIYAGRSISGIPEPEQIDFEGNE